MTSHGEPLLDSESAYPWYCGSVSGEESSRPGHADGKKLAAKSPRWPWFIWFLLKLIGLYNRRPAVARRRLCLQCRLTATEMRCVIRGEGVPGYLYPGATASEQELEGPADSGPTGMSETRFMVNEEADSGDRPIELALNDDRCVVCQSEWWDAYGRCRPYTDAQIGVTKWNHCGSAVLSVIWQVLVIVSNMAHFLYYFIIYWGRAEQKVDLVIYSGFVLFVVSVPVLCLTANVINMLPSWQRQCAIYSWSNALGLRYIVKRLQHLRLKEQGLPYKAFLAACIVWPLGNSAWRIVVFVNSDRMPDNSSVAVDAHGDGHKSLLNVSLATHPSHDRLAVNISLAACTISMTIWGVFCYLVVLMRLSFQRQLTMELAFLRRHSGTLDRCRRRLSLFMEEFGSLGSLVAIWIMFTIAVAAWSIATQVYYDYAIHDMMENKTSPKFYTHVELDHLIWSEITMFLLLPLVAVGGLDLNGLWLRFKRHVGEMRLLRGRKCDEFCDKILAFCDEHPPVRNIETMTFLVSALGLCLAVEFQERGETDLLRR